MKKRIYKGIISALPLMCLVIFSACKDPMNDYYGDSEYKAPGRENMLSVLKSNPQYSTFTYLLEETGMDQLIKDNTLLTIWVPRNEDMPYEIATLTPEEKVMLIRNHMSLGSVTTNILTNFSTVISLTERYMPVRSDAAKKVFYVDNAPLVNTDIMCANGVIHEISKWFVPRVNLYELLLNLGDEYSIFRDSIKNRTDSIFDSQSSIPSGVDENGFPVYDDSIKIGSNIILDKSDLSDMTKTFTFFIPTDEAMLQMFSDMTNYLVAAEYPLTSKDTSMWVEWMLKASIQTGYQTYAPETVLTGVTWPAVAGTDYRIRTDYQIAYDQTPDQYANGWAYTLDRISIPRTLYVKEQKANPYYIRNEYGGTNSSEGLDEWATPVRGGGINNETGSGPKSGNLTVFWQFGGRGNIDDAYKDAWYRFKTYFFEKDAEDNDVLIPVNIMPGYYDIYMNLVSRDDGLLGEGGYKNKTDSLRITIGDDYQVTVSGITRGLYTNKDEGIKINGLNPVYISGALGPREILIEVPDFREDLMTEEEATELRKNRDYYRAWRRIEVGTVRFVPNGNY